MQPKTGWLSFPLIQDIKIFCKCCLLKYLASWHISISSVFLFMHLFVTKSCQLLLTSSCLLLFFWFCFLNTFNGKILKAKVHCSVLSLFDYVLTSFNIQWSHYHFICRTRVVESPCPGKLSDTLFFLYHSSLHVTSQCNLWPSLSVSLIGHIWVHIRRIGQSG